MEKVMKYIVTISLALLSASPAFAGGSGGGGSKGGGLSVFAPITTAVSALNVTALNNVSVLSGNKTNVAALVPVSLKNTNILSGILGGGSSHGCGCD
jgi:hypothetical protein